MSNVPAELKYTQDHEWIKIEGNTITMGITDHAQEQLTDIVFVELPEVGATFNKKDSIASIESVKAVSDVYAPAAGKIVEVNPGLEDSPEVMNSDPYGEGWICKLEVSDPSELDELFDADAYTKHIG
jgi:glycine cleavage system H protein